MRSFRDGFTALVVGASGGIGSAVAESLSAMDRCAHVVTLSRSAAPGLDLLDEKTVHDAASHLQAQAAPFDLIFVATGVLGTGCEGPEKSLAAIDPDVMSRIFAVNTIGSAVLFKHFADLLTTEAKSAFALLSARVGSIADNRTGGWYSYRASKAALNQVVRCAAIEISRKRPRSVCIALHPGTVETPLTRPYARGRYTHTPGEAARKLLHVIDTTEPDQTGAFLDYDGETIPW